MPGVMRSSTFCRSPRAASQLLQQAQLLEAVDHHEAHAAGEGVLELVPGLVVAVEEDLLGREAGHLGHVVLAARRHVDGQALLEHQLGYRHGRRTPCWRR